MTNKIWLCSDTHFNHYNLIRGTSSWKDKTGCRDFNFVEDHDNLILENLNSLVMPEDTLYHLGDFTVGSMPKFSKVDAYWHFRNRINCNHIIYVRGNHSLGLEVLKDMNVFTSVHDYYELKYNGKFIVMSHYPFLSWHNMSKSSYMLHGHCHSNMEEGRRKDIGVDSNNFKPYLLDDVIEKLRNNEVLTEGHHN